MELWLISGRFATNNIYNFLTVSEECCLLIKIIILLFIKFFHFHLSLWIKQRLHTICNKLFYIILYEACVFYLFHAEKCFRIFSNKVETMFPLAHAYWCFLWWRLFQTKCRYFESCAMFTSSMQKHKLQFIALNSFTLWYEILRAFLL